MSGQADLFGAEPSVPLGFEYRPGFITPLEEAALTREIEQLPFSRVEMRGGIAKRRTAHFGWTYGYDARRTEPGLPIPEFLWDLRSRAASWSALAPEELAEALITEYTPGAAIGWHRDAPMFGDVIVGVSLLGACRMKFRRYVSPTRLSPPAGRPPRRTTHEIDLEPRSAYVISGVARREFEHSIPAVDQLRYSITFRTLRSTTGRRS
jgi:alkylated DNA repair protein (DNA oxidative demethylase)